MLWLSSLNQAMVNFVAYPAVNLGTIQLVTAAPPKCGPSPRLGSAARQSFGQVRISRFY